NEEKDTQNPGNIVNEENNRLDNQNRNNFKHKKDRMNKRKNKKKKR
ncbi:MAG: hypothetical protein HFJ46_01370, partial [Clostridia bacterium]|nr:hypothetical protein [Clostridia bacterium]